MASISKTGHVKKVANFNVLIQLEANMAAKYNPGVTAINLQNLQRAYEAAAMWTVST